MKHGYHSLNLKERRITVWIGENGARPKIARRSRSVKHVLYTLFFDARGIVARIPVPEHKTVIGIYYAEQVLPVVVNHYMVTRPRTRVRGLSFSTTMPQPTAQPALVAQLDVPSDWRPGGCGFNHRRGWQHSFVEIDHEIFSTVILSLPLNVHNTERMCTILVNCLED